MRFARDPGTQARMVSLDQFRGYTVAGMFLVNFLGGFAVVHGLFKHNNDYCSYADTIMPQFFFAVGFAYRLTFARGIAKSGKGPVFRHAIVRNLTLIGIGQIIYGFNPLLLFPDGLSSFTFIGLVEFLYRTSTFQALTHIGVTCFWILPVIGAAPWVRILFLVFSAALHLGFSHAFYYDWLWSHGAIDGGPLGFLSWTIPTLVGSLAYDAIQSRGAKGALRALFGYAILLMLLGYGLSCGNAVGHALAGDTTVAGIGRWLAEPPFVPPTHPTDIWTMSQKAGSVSYLTFAAGFSLLVYALLVLACDIAPLRLGFLRTLGQNALIGYLLSYLVEATIEFWAPSKAPLGPVLLYFLLFFCITYGLMRILEWRRIYLRL